MPRSALWRYHAWRARLVAEAARESGYAGVEVRYDVGEGGNGIEVWGARPHGAPARLVGYYPGQGLWTARFGALLLVTRADLVELFRTWEAELREEPGRALDRSAVPAETFAELAAARAWNALARLQADRDDTERRDLVCGGQD